VSGYQQVSATSTTGSVTATCPPGKVVVGGGGYATNNGSGTVSVTGSYPASTSSWIVTAERQSGNGGFTVTAFAICATSA
jgi:hypothetical protein